jgi:hypothetical protein
MYLFFFFFTGGLSGGSPAILISPGGFVEFVEAEDTDIPSSTI